MEPPKPGGEPGAVAIVPQTLGDIGLETTRLPATAARLAVMAAVIAVALIRLRFLDVPLERDEGEYAYTGQLLLQGIPPYRLAYTMKLPGTHAAYAVAMWLFGETVPGLRLGLLVVNAATTLLVFVLARRLLGRFAACAAATTFAFLSVQTEMLGPFGHATHFVLLPAMTGLVLFVHALESRRVRTMFMAGAMMGLGVLMKQPGVVFALFGCGWLLWTHAGAADRSPRRLLSALGALIIGTILPTALVATALTITKDAASFWFWVFRYGTEYAVSVPLSEGIGLFWDAVARIVPPAMGLFAIAAAGLVASVRSEACAPSRAFVLSLLALSFLGVCPGLYFREHYFIIALPAVSLLVGLAFRSLQAWYPRRAIAVGSAVLVLACAQTVYAQRAVYFTMSPAEIARALYGANPFAESVEVARYLARHTRPEDRVAVLGSEPQIYFYSRRRSATGFIYMYPLMEKQPFAHAMQQQLVADIEAARPAYVVWVKVAASWLAWPDSEGMVFEWARTYLAREYEIAGQVVLDRDGPLYLWDDARARTAVTDATTVLVLRRKASGPPIR
jgi:4-amino-4-deoxy-L-arabinose transferase-like glycosyltransferase